jgi:hypothetical protein
MNMGTPEQINPTAERDQFMKAARSRILDGKDLYEEIGSEIHYDQENWRELSIEVQSFWINLAASVRASESIVVEINGRSIAQNLIGARP